MHLLTPFGLVLRCHSFLKKICAFEWVGAGRACTVAALSATPPPHNANKPEEYGVKWAREVIDGREGVGD